MIVLDENLDEHRVMAPLKQRYKGKVVSIKNLRPGTVIKDEAIPAILCQCHNATFVTTNVSDFWRRASAHPRYCIVCIPLPTERQDELPSLLLRLLHHRAFSTVRRRMGNVIRLSRAELLCYQGAKSISKLPWP